MPTHAGDVTLGRGTSFQSLQMSVIIPTLPYHFRHASPSGSNEQNNVPECSVSEPDSIDSLMVKVSCRKGKVERNFVLTEVDIKDIRTPVAHSCSGQCWVCREGKEKSMLPHTRMWDMAM